MVAYYRVICYTYLVIKKSELDRAVFKACGLAEVGTTILKDLESEARINIIKQITNRIQYLNARIEKIAAEGRKESRFLVSELEDCANQLVGLYQ